jgi:hypothetical protein
MRSVRRCLALLGVITLVAITPLSAAVLPEPSPLQDKAFRHPDLGPRELQEKIGSLEPGVAERLQADLTAMGLAADSAVYDSRGGRFGSLVLSEPLVPGAGVGNTLRWPDGAGSPGEAQWKALVWSSLTAWLQRHQDRLKVDVAELEGTPSIGVFEGGAFIAVHARRVLGGITVRDSGVSAVINHGNLVLVGLQNWGDAAVPAAPGFGAGQARAVVTEHARPFVVLGLRQEPHLELVPTAPGARYEYRLAWVVSAAIEGDLGSWEGLVDAHSGELLAFEDMNLYAARKVMGGVFPVSNDGRPPDGQEQGGWPMPFANVVGNGFTDHGGNVLGCVAGSATTTLVGQFVRMNDNCGAISESGPGDIDLGASAGTDCVVPAGHSAGDTHSSRSGFYELNRIKEQARGYLPGNAWLSAVLQSNMNINNTCNAFWQGASQTVNFYRDNGSQCRNTGEIAAIFDHEWGHGMDDNGVNGSISSPGEAIADIHAILRLSNSCVGRGFLKNSTCGGYGDPCTGTPTTGCTGVRDSDFANHRCNRPHGISWILNGFTVGQCPSGAAAACPAVGQRGPCNRETHCEGQIAAEVGWDLHFRDLRAAPFNLDANTALELTTRLTYLASQTLTSWYTCSVGGGCGATGGYLLYLAADDDNGSLTDGTPHMSAIRAAFERHEIHCTMQTVTNSGCAGGPTGAPTLTATAGPGSASLSWTSVPGASRYYVYRTEGVAACNFGKIKIADTTGTSFVDTGLQGGRSYYYAILPVGSNTACFGLMSACGTVVAGAPNDPCITTPTISFTAASSSRAENNGPAPVVVAITTPGGLPTTAPATVQFATANGTATAPSDFTAASGTLTFPTGTASGATQTINVTLINDAVVEPPETFTVGLSNPTGAALGAVTTHTVTITDDDAAVFIRGDFNSDGRTDILWRHDVSGENVLWYMNGAVLAGGEFLTPAALTDTRWKMVGTHDFNADLKNDILWRHDTAGENVLWFMNGSVMTSGTFLTPAALVDINWKMAGTGLFNTDGRPDIAWHHQVSGEVVLWYMNGSVLVSGTFTSPSSFPDTNWRLVGVADFSSPLDNKPDFVWRHQVTGGLLVWFMDNATRIGETPTTPAALADTRWKLVATGDYNLDLRNDFVWRHDDSGENVIWFMNGAALIGGTFTNPATFPDVRWKIVGPR